MDRARRRDRATLPALLLIAMMSTAATPAAMWAGLRPVAQPTLDCLTVTQIAAARAALGSSNAAASTVRVQSQVSKRGELTGRVLTGLTAAGSPMSIALPAESFVAPAVGDLIVYTRSSAVSGSEVRALSLATGCDTRLASPPEIVRSAVIDPAATSIYVHSVNRAGRADAGVVRYDLATGEQVAALPALRTPEAFGPIFGTNLEWGFAGDALAVQSCGFRSCLTRVLDIATGSVATFDGPGQGAFIGLTIAHLLTFADCPGLPCAVLSTELSTGVVSGVADEAYSAGLEASGDGEAVVTIETSAGQVEVIQ